MERESSNNGGITGSELAVSLLSEVKAEVPGIGEVGKKQFRYTKEAHKRVVNSVYSRDLNRIFAGQFNVSLREVELAVLELQKSDPNDGRKGLMRDPDSEDDIVQCELPIANVCMKVFMPKTWDKKPGKKDFPGNYVPDYLDEEGKEFVIVAQCPACHERVCKDISADNDEIDKQNEELKKQGKPLLEKKHFPRAMSLDSATKAFDRRAYAIKMENEGAKLAEEKKQHRIRETVEDTRRAVSRLASAKPSIPRGVNRKNFNPANNGRNSDW